MISCIQICTHNPHDTYFFGLPSDLPDAELDVECESTTRKKGVVGKGQPYTKKSLGQCNCEQATSCVSQTSS